VCEDSLDILALSRSLGVDPNLPLKELLEIAEKFYAPGIDEAALEELLLARMREITRLPLKA
jgi:hypothetical protein